MKGKLFLPFFPEKPLASSQSDISDEQYAKQLLDMYDNGYMNFMDQAMGTMMNQRYGVMEVMPEKYAIESVKDNGNVDYYAFDAQVNNEEEQNMSDDEFMFYANSGDMCAFFLHLSVDEDNADSVDELNSWLKESRRIMNNPHIEDDYRVGMLPARDLIIEFRREDSPMFVRKFKLCGARVIDQDSNKHFAIIVTKIEPVK